MQLHIKLVLPDQLKDIYRKERADETGDVIILIRRWKDSDGDNRNEEIGFLGVRNPREVENILKQLAQITYYSVSRNITHHLKEKPI
jgi:hypothetical protein